MSKNRFNNDFEILVECIGKRPEEYAEKIVNLESRLEKTLKAVEEIYESGDYSRNTERLLRVALGLDDLTK